MKYLFFYTKVKIITRNEKYVANVIDRFPDYHSAGYEPFAIVPIRNVSNFA